MIIIVYLCNIIVLLPYDQNDRMDSTLISDEYLFALCITDGLLEEMDERQRSLVLLSITETLKKNLSADSD